MKRLELELAKARLSVENNKWKEKLEAAKVTAVDAFHSLEKLRKIKIEFGSESYLQGAADFKAKVQSYFPDLNLKPLESNDKEEVDEVGDKEVQIEKIFSLAHGDHAAEDIASAQPPAVIIFSDPSDASESLAPDGA